MLHLCRRKCITLLCPRKPIDSGLKSEVYADADYASTAADRRSVSGGLAVRGGSPTNGFLHRSVKLLTTEAEQLYAAVAESIKEELFMRHVWCFLLPGADVPCMRVFEDSQWAV